MNFRAAFVTCLTSFVLALSSAHASSFGDESKTLVTQLGSTDDAKVQEALEGLKKLGAGGVDGLLQATKHKQTWVRAAAWRWLGELGADAKPALAPLCAAITRDPRDEWAATFEMALGFGMQMGMIDALVTGAPVSAPKGMSKEEQADFERLTERLAAMAALGKIGATDLDAFVLAIEKAELKLDQGYCDLHVCFGVAAKSAKEKGTEIVTAGLAHASPRVQVASLLACCMNEKKSSALGDGIAKLLDSPQPAVRGLAAETLVRVRYAYDKVKARLLELTHDDSGYVRVQAARALAVGADDPSSTVPVLEACMSDASTFVRMAAINTLESLSEAPLFGKPRPGGEFRAPSAVKPLTTALADASAAVRKRAASTLGNYGKIAEPALPALRKCVKDPEKEVRNAAEGAIRDIEKG